MTEEDSLNLLKLRLQKRDRRLPKTSQVYEVLRGAIIAMELAPGTALHEKPICEVLEVSRTPFREALLQLGNENLIQMSRGDGIFVNQIDLAQVLEGQMMRDTYEMRLTKLAARRFEMGDAHAIELILFQQNAADQRGDYDEFFRLDNTFHECICGMSGFPRAWQTVHMACGQLDRVRRLAFPLEENNMRSTIDEHEKIFEALKNNDEDKIADAFQIQLNGTFFSIEVIRNKLPGVINSDAIVSLKDIQ
ncbi:GntR family transcriptional regulator [Agrobacterium rosae]|uniref:GntR family transcriptional regulator n=1 Tax=Agrobacterium rosae TaxID=1972867 RepID=UPI0020348E0D|nr:GntR family transcriptional regulator [Agrobacterium rosae]MCM2435772.1 GntR family transcriptional regulator [Agrobacterium rosae]